MGVDGGLYIRHTPLQLTYFILPESTMNTDTTFDFSDLDDLDTAVVSDAPATSYLEASSKFASNHTPTQWELMKARKSADRPVIDCPKCRGTGKFYSYTGRLVGNCLKCDGSGKTIGLKQDAASVKAREQAAARRDAKKVEAEAAKAAWREEHADVLNWIARNDRFDFAISLGEAIEQAAGPMRLPEAWWA
jgi:excinuclease UvrABC ATPase subunit